mmetsp:Transcript_7134/g.11240  ORF Transcript_7134/g.11240 Transcript_7134/m.11240 type:complete len:94 (+) Transcript_7134:334-615(+)
MEEEEKNAQDEFKRQQAEAIKEPEKVDLAKVMGQSKNKKKEDSTSKLLSRMIAPKRKDGGTTAAQPNEKKPKTEDTSLGLSGLAAYDDSDEED